MSYDLMIFRPKAAPEKRGAFMDWYTQQVEWGEDHSYEDPKVASKEMQHWFLEMIEAFPAMNGPYADENIETDYLTDYCIGKDVIYVGFRWSVAEEAYKQTKLLAEKHRVGFFDVSANDGNIFFPGENGMSYQIDSPQKESSIEEIKAWGDEDSNSKTVGDIVLDKMKKQLKAQDANASTEEKKSWWKRIFKS